MSKNSVLLLILAGAFMTSCSNGDLLPESNGSDGTIPDDESAVINVGKDLSTERKVNLNINSPVAAVISIFKDRSCTQESRVAVNMPIAEGDTIFSLTLPNDCEILYVVYPVNGGEAEVVPLDLKATTTPTTRYKLSEETYTLNLPENAVDAFKENGGELKNNDRFDTYYHSSGVVMFDDGWPKVSSENADFNNLVIDYDLETKVGSIKKVAYRLPVNHNNFMDHYVDVTGYIPLTTQLKVVMHIRAVGSVLPAKAGVILEGLESSQITASEVKVTLGNYGAIPAGSLTASIKTNGENPVITIDNLQWLLSDAAKNYTYQKDGGSEIFEMNKKDATYYNTERGCINSGGDLFTITAIFKGVEGTNGEFTGTYPGEFNRYVELNTAPSAKSFINSVMNTENQNFFLTTTQGYEIHLKGYQPGSVKDYMEAIAQVNAVKMDPNSTYCSKEGLPWGVKVPVRTKHVYEHERLIETYLLFKEWCESEGKKSETWYLNDKVHCDDTKIVPWW